MTENILKLIDIGAIRSIAIKPMRKGTLSYEQGYPYEANIRYEWATDAIMDFKTLDELDRKIRKSLQVAAERYTSYIETALEMMEQEDY